MKDTNSKAIATEAEKMVNFRRFNFEHEKYLTTQSVYSDLKEVNKILEYLDLIAESYKMAKKLNKKKNKMVKEDP